VRNRKYQNPIRIDSIDHFVGESIHEGASHVIAVTILKFCELPWAAFDSQNCRFYCRREFCSEPGYAPFIPLSGVLKFDFRGGMQLNFHF